jgi:hypothetical protein
VYPYPEQIQMLQNSISQLKLELVVVAIVAALLLALVLVLGILLSRKKPAPPQPFFGEPIVAPPPAGDTALIVGVDANGMTIQVS